MASTIRIRRVNVEFLRPGRSHNQLLSPYTQYLGVCNEAGIDVVRVPYEHRVFERRLKELRYETGDQSDRLDMLHEIGTDLGRMLEAVPGLTGELAPDRDKSDALVHLRLTLSAAELALLPFELAQVPVGSSGSAISIQTRPPVALTRHIRTVSSDDVVWPRRPRVLFVAGDPDNIPFLEHRDALVAAIQPFRYPNRDEATGEATDARQQFGDLLTVLVDPTLAELQRECSAQFYTHIHILTHGDLDVMSQESYGLAMHNDAGSTDVVSGERFVSAIVRVGHRPSVVTIASCDSGNVGSVVIPGASFAHAVHAAGIPLVVGAQFPLSIEGSVPLAQTLYTGLLWGEHPLLVVQRARAELHARYNSDWHDWASLVVYEALPQMLDDQLDSVVYLQARQAMNAALERVDNAVLDKTAEGGENLKVLNAAVDNALDRMPLDGQFAVECIGLRASASKRLAQGAFMRAQHAPGSAVVPGRDPVDLLERARCDYRHAAKGMLVNDARALQRVATLHWVMVQLVALNYLLEGACDLGEWETAKLCADYYCDHTETEQRAWAHGSLAELWLVRLADATLSADERKQFRENAVREAETLSRLYPGIDKFPVKSTRRQFERYVHWWGHADFAEMLASRGVERSEDAWTGAMGVVSTAERLVKVLGRRPHAGVGAPVPSAPLAGGGGTSAARPTAGHGAGRSRPAGRRAKAQPAAALADAQRDGTFFDIEVLPAGHGDCLWIEYGDDTATHRWLIDCGTQATSTELLRRVDAVPENERMLELFVLSHIDSDHIGGALPFFKAVQQGLRFGDVWFNGWRHISGQLGARQGEMFSTAIQDFELPWNAWRAGGTIVVSGNELPTHVLPGGMKLTLLSPRPEEIAKLKPVWTRELKKYGLEPGTRVDYKRFLKGTPSTSTNVDELADTPFGGDNSAPNGTSIALLAEFADARALLTADAHAPVVVESIRKLLGNDPDTSDKLHVDVFKVSHHGSQNNVSSELIQALDCQHYVISTNGNHFAHPDRQAIARILKYGGTRPSLYFNYRTRYNEVWAREDLQEKYAYAAHYPPADRPGIIVPVLRR